MFTNLTLFKEIDKKIVFPASVFVKSELGVIKYKLLNVAKNGGT